MGTTPTPLIMANPFSPEYQQQKLVQTLQQQAVASNAQAESAYLAVAHDWLINVAHERDAGRPPSPLADPPLKIHVDDKGVQTSGPDFVTQKPVLPPPTGVTGTVTIAAQGNAVPPDRLDQVILGLGEMWKVLLAIRDKVGA